MSSRGAYRLYETSLIHIKPVKKNMRNFRSFFLLCTYFISLFYSVHSAQNLFDVLPDDPSIIIKQINLEKFPSAFNPSIIKFNKEILLTFRYCPDGSRLWVSYIGVVLLNNNLEPISEPQLLEIDKILQGNCTAHHEDARLFSYNGQVYIVYGDFHFTSAHACDDAYSSTMVIKEEMTIAKLHFENNRFKIRDPLRLIKHPPQMREKNWTPFIWNGELLFSYYPVPHEILQPNLMTGNCSIISKMNADINWLWGEMRGGTPAAMFNGDYLSFFHSSVYMKSSISNDRPRMHYFMGAYTFSSQPPFEIKKISCIPLKASGIYTNSDKSIRGVFPGGYIIMNQNFYLAYGKDDSEIWIAQIPQETISQSLVPVSSH